MEVMQAKKVHIHLPNLKPMTPVLVHVAGAFRLCQVRKRFHFIIPRFRRTGRTRRTPKARRAIIRVQLIFLRTTPSLQALLVGVAAGHYHGRHQSDFLGSLFLLSVSFYRLNEIIHYLNKYLKKMK